MDNTERSVFYKVGKLVHWHLIAFKNNYSKLSFKNGGVFRKIRVDLRWHYTTFMFDFRDIISDNHYGRKSGIYTFGRFDANEAKSANGDETIYQPTPFKTLKAVFSKLPLFENDILLDAGSGMGRVVFFAAMYKIKKVIGIELRPSMHNIALANYAKLKKKEDYAPIEFILGDITMYDVKDVTVFFLFNPFGLKTLSTLMDNIKQTLIGNPRNIRLVYFYYGEKSECNDYLDSLEWLPYHTVVGTGSIYSNTKK